MKVSIAPFKGVWPQVDESVFLADGVRILGDVRIADSAGIWFNSVVRGDENSIRIGRFTNIQDNTTIHVQDTYSCTVGDYVTVGHNSLLHGCRIANNCIIGMGSVIMNGVEIGENCIVGAGSLITENKVIPANSLVVGSPARVIRKLEPEQIESIRESALHYQKMAAEYVAYQKTVETK
jgi:carbonic anhydrase/acetyltransferase-like protein (isoleucine patch superfamily)